MPYRDAVEATLARGVADGEIPRVHLQARQSDQVPQIAVRYAGLAVGPDSPNRHAADVYVIDVVGVDLQELAQDVYRYLLGEHLPIDIGPQTTATPPGCTQVRDFVVVRVHQL